VQKVVLFQSGTKTQLGSLCHPGGAGFMAIVSGCLCEVATVATTNTLVNIFEANIVSSSTAGGG